MLCSKPLAPNATWPGAEVMANQYRQLVIHRETPASWRVTFDHPPINLVDSETLRELAALMSEVESSEDVKVLIFDSADPDFFLAQWDVSSAAGQAPAWSDISLRMAYVPAVSIALIRGRARGMGSEFALGCDLRFASMEKAILGHPGRGVEPISGRGSLERLPLLVGPARALEIVLGGADFDAVTAKRYGWVNRALPDTQLDAFVTDFARRLAVFEKLAIAEAKLRLSRDALPALRDMEDSLGVFHRAFAWPTTKLRTRRLL